jgi:hypothetical protein
MDVYTQSNQEYFSLSGIIKLVNNRIQWKLNVRVALSAQFSKYNRYSDTSFLFTSSNVRSPVKRFKGPFGEYGEKQRPISGIVIDTDQFKQTKTGG